MIQYDHHLKVYYKDIDQMGIVYYSRYLEYFEEARTELLSSIGLDVTSVEKNGIQLPVITSHCDYHRGAELEQNLIIRTIIYELPKAKLRIDYQVLTKENTEQIILTGYTIHAFLNINGRPVRPPANILDKIKKQMNEY